MTASLRAFGRLVWHPASIVWLYPLFLALVWPFVNQGESLDNGLGVGSPTFLSGALWTESVVLMGLLGVAMSATGREAHQPLFAFTVPSLRARVLKGEVICGTLIAAVLALGLVYVGDAGNAVAIMACGMLFFALGTSIGDPISPRSASVAIGVFFLVAALQSWRMRFVFESAPVVASIAALILAVAMLQRHWATDSARRRAVFQTPPIGFVTGIRFKRAYSEGREVELVPWRATPAVGRLRDWVRAADYEGFGARRHGWIRFLVGSVFYYSGAAYVLNNPGFAALLGMMLFSLSGHRLLGSWVYPIGRRARADLHFICSLVDSTAYYLLAWGVIVALEVSGLPRVSMFAPIGNQTLKLILFPIPLIWAPVVQWFRVTGPAPTNDRMKSPLWLARMALHGLGAITLAFPTYELARWIGRTYSVALAVIAMIALAGLVQLLYWLALRWHFTRRNLV